MVPAERLLKIPGGKSRKDYQGNNFLHHFKLRYRKIRVSYAVGRHLKTILNKSNSPAH